MATPFPTVLSVIILLGGDQLEEAQFLTLIAQFSQNYNDNASQQIYGFSAQLFFFVLLSRRGRVVVFMIVV